MQAVSDVCIRTSITWRGQWLRQGARILRPAVAGCRRERCGIRQGRRTERDPRRSPARMYPGTRSRGLLPRRFRDSPLRALCARCRARRGRPASSRRRRVRHVVPGGPRFDPGSKRRRALCERTAFTSAWISAMVMARKSDAPSISAALNRPSMAQRRRFSRSIASIASEASNPACRASSTRLSGRSTVSVATIWGCSVRCEARSVAPRVRWLQAISDCSMMWHVTDHAATTRSSIAFTAAITFVPRIASFAYALRSRRSVLFPCRASTSIAKVRFCCRWCSE